MLSKIFKGEDEETNLEVMEELDEAKHLGGKSSWHLDKHHRYPGLKPKTKSNRILMSKNGSGGGGLNMKYKMRRDQMESFGKV